MDCLMCHVDSRKFIGATRLRLRDFMQVPMCAIPCGYLSKTLVLNARSPTKVESVTVSWQVDATGLYVDSTAYPSITG